MNSIGTMHSAHAAAPQRAVGDPAHLTAVDFTQSISRGRRTTSACAAHAILSHAPTCPASLYRVCNTHVLHLFIPVKSGVTPTGALQVCNTPYNAYTHARFGTCCASQVSRIGEPVGSE